MGTSEKFCLRWNDFEKNISGAFRELREDKDFFDVTLACDDDQLLAHKVILSACSPFFRSILRRNRHEHPLLFLKGVKYVDLVSVLNFMYHGEVNVAQEELNSFLEVAEELQVKGLTQSNATSGQVARSDATKPRPRDPPAPAERVEPTPQVPKRPKPASSVPVANTIREAPVQAATYQADDDDIQEVVPVKSEPLSYQPDTRHSTVASMSDVEPHFTHPINTGAHQQQQGVLADPTNDYGEEYADYEGYETGVDSYYEGSTMDNSGMSANDGNKDEIEALITSHLSKTQCLETGKTIWQCNKCDKAAKVKTQMKNHVESIHLSQLLIFSCTMCDHTNHTSAGLKMHMRNKHN